MSGEGLTPERYGALKLARLCVSCRRPTSGGVRCGRCLGFVTVSRTAYQRIYRAAHERGLSCRRLVELALANLPEVARVD